jgi:hypothetical protein
MGAVLFLHSGRQIEQQKNNKKKIQPGLRWPPFNILHATTNRKHVGATEKRWDRMRNPAVTLGEQDFIILGVVELGGKKKHDALALGGHHFPIKTNN